MSLQHLQWPDDYPNNCPPFDASITSATIYRLVHEPICAEDFQSEFELNQRLRLRLEAEGNEEIICRSRGLSVFSELQGAIVTRKRIRRFRKASIAVGNLAEECGLMKPTPSERSHRTHCTWWVPVNVEPNALFEIVRE